MRAFGVKYLFYPLYELATGRRVLSKWRELEKTQWLSRDEVLQLQWGKLRRLLAHAYANVPFYRHRFETARVTPADIRTPADMERIPPLTKQDLRQHLDELIATNANRSQLRRNATGGSTGEPTVFFNDRLDLDYGSAVVLRNYRWVGLEPGETHVMLWGSAFDLSLFASAKGRLTNWVLDRHILSAFEMTEASLLHYIDVVHRLRPRVITGYASALELLASYILQSGVSFQPQELRAVLSTAETLRPDQRALMERAFGCPIFDRYGSREVGCVAHECEHRGLHVNAENLYVEVVQDGHPVPTGEFGELAVTTLNNYGFPFIRYLIGDAGSLLDEPCPCGRGLPVLGKLFGRVHDILVTPDGRFLPGEFFPHLFKDVVGVERFQVIQRELGRLLIRILPNDAYRPSDTDFVLEKTRQVVGEQMQVEVEFVDELPTLPSGKTRFTVSEIGIEFSRCA
jgi:phenylacetate-CoA ligase